MEKRYILFYYTKKGSFFRLFGKKGYPKYFKSEDDVRKMAKEKDIKIGYIMELTIKKGDMEFYIEG